MENYKALLREMSRDKSRWRDPLYLGTERVNAAKMEYNPIQNFRKLFRRN